MIDTETETLCLISRAHHHVPGEPKPHYQTPIRWALRGLRGEKLETLMIGGRRYTSLEAIRRFIGRLSGEKAGETRQLSEGKRNALALVEARLDAEGIS